MHSKHIYIHICIQHSSILVHAGTSEAIWKLPVLQRWRVLARFGPERPSTQRQHDTKDTAINTLPAALLMQALAVCLQRLTYGKTERQRQGKDSQNTYGTTCRRVTEALEGKYKP